MIAKIFSFSLFLLISHGCVKKDSYSDTTKRDLDRQKVVANELEQQQSQLKGTFAGTIGSSKIKLMIDMARQSVDGSLVPQPKLVGALVFSPSVLVDNAGKPMNITYFITGGQFDGARDLSITVQQNGTSTSVYCTTEDLNILNCNWYSTDISKFTLQRISYDVEPLISKVPPKNDDNKGGVDKPSQPQGTPITKPEKFGGEYVGQNSHFVKIKAYFRTLLTPQNGSNATPQISIVGSFTFFQEQAIDLVDNSDDANTVNDNKDDPNRGLSFAKFSFVDGEYDPALDTLVIKISGDNSIVVNCRITSETSLHCTWIGNHGLNNYEEFDLKQASSTSK